MEYENGEIPIECFQVLEQEINSYEDSWFSRYINKRLNKFHDDPAGLVTWNLQVVLQLLSVKDFSTVVPDGLRKDELRALREASQLKNNDSKLAVHALFAVNERQKLINRFRRTINTWRQRK